MNEGSLKTLKNIFNPEGMKSVRLNLLSIDSLVSQVTELDSFTKAVEQMNRQSNFFQPFQYGEMSPATSALSTIGKASMQAFEPLQINTTKNELGVLSKSKTYLEMFSKPAFISAQTVLMNNAEIADLIKSTKMFDSSIHTVGNIQRIFENNLSIFQSGDFARNAIGQLSKGILETNSISGYHERISALASYEALLRFNDFPYDEVYEKDLSSKDSLSVTIVDLDTQISDELSSVGNFEGLSDDTKKQLSYIYHEYILPLTFILLSIYLSILVNSHITKSQEELKILETKQEIQSFIRSPSTTFSREAFKGYRVTIANNLNLRDNCSMNSNIIDVLPIGTVVRIVDKSNRSWLKVEVEINGEAEQGWVLRRYTTYFK